MLFIIYIALYTYSITMYRVDKYTYMQQQRPGARDARLRPRRGRREITCKLYIVSYIGLYIVRCSVHKYMQQQRPGARDTRLRPVCVRAWVWGGNCYYSILFMCAHLHKTVNADRARAHVCMTVNADRAPSKEIVHPGRTHAHQDTWKSILGPTSSNIYITIIHIFLFCESFRIKL